MRLKNFWLQKRREKNLLKVVEWAQKNGRFVESLTKQEIIDAMRSQR
jgi:hypothetical protein